MRCAILFLLLGLVACGPGEPGILGKAAPLARDSAADEDITALVPHDAHILVRMRSLDAAEEALANIAKHAGVPMMALSPSQQISMMTGVPVSRMDRTRPVAVAMRIARTMPVPTFVLPVGDPASVAAGFTNGGSSSRGDYAGLSMSPAYKPGGSSLAAGMPGGDVAVRLDLAKMIELYRYEVDQSLAMAGMAAHNVPDFDPSNLIAGIREALDAAKTLDITASLDGSRLDLGLALALKEGGPEAGADASGLADLATLLAEDMPFVTLVRLDIDSMVDLLGSLATATAGPRSALVQQQVARLKEMTGLFGDDWLMALDFHGQGMRGVFAGRAKDAPAALEQYTAFLRDDPSMQVALEGTRKVGATSVHRVRLKLEGARGGDLAKIYGDKGLLLDMAAVGDRMICVAGDGALTEKVLASRAAPASVAGALASVPGNARFLMRLELRGLARGILALEGRGKPVPDGPPVPVVVYGSVDGRFYRGGLSLDLPATAALMDATR